MQRSILQFVNQLDELLLEIPRIVRDFDQKSPQALQDLIDWIGRSEALLSSHRVSAAATIAGFKSRLIASAYTDDRRGTLRRRQLAIATGMIDELQRSVQDALRPYAEKIRQSRDLGRQLLQIVAQSGAVKYDAGLGFEALITQIWALCSSHDQLKPFAIQLKILLPTDDIRLLLAEEIDLIDFAKG